MGVNKTFQFSLLVFVFIAPAFLMNTNVIASKTLKTQDNLLETTFDISEAHLSFNIHPEGTYDCDFVLEVVGNEYTSQGNAKGEFQIYYNTISNMSLKLFGSPITFSISSDGNSSLCTFLINQELPLGSSSWLTGYFQGEFQDNTSNIYTFQLGVDWGVIVGALHTSVYLDGSKIALIPPILPQPHEITATGNRMEFSWSEVLVSGFNTTVKVRPRTIPNTFLKVDSSSWNAEKGQSIAVPIQNVGPIVIYGYVVTPVWIDSTITRFTLAPNENLTVIFSINSNARPDMNGTIEILAGSGILIEYADIRIKISVTVLSEKTPLLDMIIQLLPIILITAGGMLSILFFLQRDTILPIIQNMRNHFRFTLNNKKELVSTDATKNSILINNESRTDYPKFTWESIFSRWESILSDRELKVLEVLYNQGSMNQQAIANQIGVSKVTMSRLISRLEAKRLLTRERRGMSNLIRLNKDRL
ncbi:MAG: helix-turn-helix transcriptional regulator [Promethearchaeota archaeon]